jgi:hypothetical protein
MRCAEFKARVNHLLDRRLPPGSDPEVVEHAHSCFACSELLSSHESLLVAVRSMPAVRLRQPGERSLAQRVMAEMEPASSVSLPDKMLQAQASSRWDVTDPARRSWYLAAGITLTTAAALFISVIALKPAPVPPVDAGSPQNHLQIAQPSQQTSTMVAKASELEPIARVGYHVADGLSQVTQSMVSALRELRKRPLFRNTDEQPRSSHYSPWQWEEGLA